MLDQQLLNLQSRGLSQQVTQLQFQRQRLPAAALNGLLRERVTRREAAQRGIVVSPAEIDERLRQQIAEYGAALLPRPTSTPTATPRPDRAPTEATPSLEPTATPVPTLTEERFGPALQAYLQQQQYTEEQLRRAIESDLYAEKLRKSIGLEVPAVQEQVQARHIVSRTEEAARTLLDRLGAGEPFAVLAASDSEDKATGDKGGELGWLFRRERDPDFEAAVFALQPGETSPVVQTAAGWEIVQVLERDPARPLDEQQLEELSDSRYSEWLSNALSTPEVERRLTQEQTDWVLRQVSGRRPG
jgi:parvulin-like peptidyl-prolyl isomerase